MEIWIAFEVFTSIFQYELSIGVSKKSCYYWARFKRARLTKAVNSLEFYFLARLLNLKFLFQKLIHNFSCVLNHDSVPMIPLPLCVRYSLVRRRILDFLIWNTSPYTRAASSRKPHAPISCCRVEGHEHLLHYIGNLNCSSSFTSVSCFVVLVVRT